MDVVTFGPVRARKIVKATGTTAKNTEASPLVVVLMHGYGAPGDDLVGLEGAIEAPRGTTFIFPEAPSMLGNPALMSLMGDARAWWEIDVGRFQRAMMRGTTAALEELTKEIPDGLEKARKDITAMLDAVESETKTSRDRIVLGGFSQGSMLALDVALRTKRPLAGLAVLSGTLIAADEWGPLMATRKDLPVFQSHGTEDPILPYAIAEKLRRALDDAGMRVTFTPFDGGHGIPPQVMRDFGTWLRALS